MRNLWSKEDLANFKKSEVLSELETRVINTVKRADILSRKISEASRYDTAGAKAFAEANSDAEKAVRSLNEAMSPADDHALEDDAQDDLQDDLQESIVDDLLALAKSAVEQGDYKLAYKIERTIDEILEHEVICG